MKIVNIQIDRIDINYIDVTEVGDPAARWRQVVAGAIEVRGYGFTESKKERVSVETSLTTGEQNQLLDLCQRVERRLVDDAK